MTHVKGRFSVALWLAGFVVAGSAAAFVNSAVLSGDTSSGQLRGASDGVTVTSLVDAADFEVEAGATPGSFVLGDAGSVQLSSDGGVLSLTSADPAAGWSVVSVDSTSATSLTVVFESNGRRLQFTAVLADGKISTTLTDLGGESDSDEPGVPTGTTVPRTPGGTSGTTPTAIATQPTLA